MKQLLSILSLILLPMMFVVEANTNIGEEPKPTSQITAYDLLQGCYILEQFQNKKNCLMFHPKERCRHYPDNIPRNVRVIAGPIVASIVEPLIHELELQ